MDIDLAKRLPQMKDDRGRKPYDIFDVRILQSSELAQEIGQIPVNATLADVAHLLNEHRGFFIHKVSEDPQAAAFPMWSRTLWRRTRPIAYGLVGAALIFPAYGIFGARFAAYFESPTANSRMEGYSAQHSKDFGDRAPLVKFSGAREREWWEIYLRTQGSKNWLLQSSSDKVLYVPGNIASVQRGLVDARDNLKNPELVRSWLRTLYYIEIDHADFLNSRRGEPSRKIVDQIFKEFDHEGLRATWEAETLAEESSAR